MLALCVGLFKWNRAIVNVMCNTHALPAVTTQNAADKVITKIINNYKRHTVIILVCSFSSSLVFTESSDVWLCKGVVC